MAAAPDDGGGPFPELQFARVARACVLRATHRRAGPGLAQLSWRCTWCLAPRPWSAHNVSIIRVSNMSTVFDSPEYQYLLRNENGNCVEAFRRSMCRVNHVHYAEFERFRAFQRDFDGVSFSCQYAASLLDCPDRVGPSTVAYSRPVCHRRRTSASKAGTTATSARMMPTTGRRSGSRAHRSGGRSSVTTVCCISSRREVTLTQSGVCGCTPQNSTKAMGTSWQLHGASWATSSVQAGTLFLSSPGVEG